MMTYNNNDEVDGILLLKEELLKCCPLFLKKCAETFFINTFGFIHVFIDLIGKIVPKMPLFTKNPKKNTILPVLLHRGKIKQK